MKSCLFGIRNTCAAVRYWKLLILVIEAFLIIIACTPSRQHPPFNPKTCLQSVPDQLNGLRIVQGVRTEKSIIRDMLPAICNGQVLFRTMQAKDSTMVSGTAVFRVVVEYTGEVKNVTVEETTIHSTAFLKRISNMIENSDFVGWARDDTDTIFFYPVDFGTP